MYTPNSEISFNSQWRMLNRGLEDSHLHKLNQSNPTDLTLQLTDGPDLVIISGDRANKYIKMGAREFSSNSRIFTIMGKAMSWEDQKMKKQIYNDQRESQMNRFNLNKKNQNEAQRLISSAKQTFIRRSRNSPNNNRYTRSSNNNRNYQRGPGTWRVKQESYTNNPRSQQYEPPRQNSYTYSANDNLQ